MHAGIATEISAVARRSPFFTDPNFLNPTNDHLVPLRVSNTDRQNRYNKYRAEQYCHFYLGIQP